MDCALKTCVRKYRKTWQKKERDRFLVPTNNKIGFRSTMFNPFRVVAYGQTASNPRSTIIIGSNMGLLKVQSPLGVRVPSSFPICKSQILKTRNDKGRPLQSEIVFEHRNAQALNNMGNGKSRQGNLAGFLVWWLIRL